MTNAEPAAETTASYTPGPWRVAELGSSRATLVLDSNEEIVSDTSDLLKSWGECEANARLIATAPRMADYILLHAERDPEARAILQEAGVLP
jgi:hypothetical protein